MRKGTALLCAAAFAAAAAAFPSWKARRAAAAEWEDLRASLGPPSFVPPEAFIQQMIQYWRRMPWYGDWTENGTWLPRGTYRQVLRLATGEDAGATPEAWEAWLAARPRLGWDGIRLAEGARPPGLEAPLGRAFAEAEWRKRLSPLQYRVTREKGTEPAFSGRFWNLHAEGAYACICCDAPLFSSGDKFDSPTGWASFARTAWEGAVGEGAAVQRPDGNMTEIVCAKCEAHLGHVCADAQAPTGRRYSVNSAALTFRPAKPAGDEVAVFAAGASREAAAAFRALKGVRGVALGYTGGDTARPTSEDVQAGGTGHAEAVEVTYDPSEVSYGKLLETFFACHDVSRDPGALSPQRSGIFARSAAQRDAAEAYKAHLERQGRPVATRILPASAFWRAE